MTDNRQELQFTPPPHIRLQLPDFLNQIRERDDFVTQAQQLLSLLGYKSSRRPLNQSGDPLEFLKLRTDQPEYKYDKIFVNATRTAKVIFQVTSEEIITSLKEKRINGVRWDKTVSNARSFMFCAVELKRDGYNPQELKEMMWSISRVYKGIPTLALFKYPDKLSIGLFDRRPSRLYGKGDVLVPRNVKEFKTNYHDEVQIATWLKLSLNSCLEWMRENGVDYNFDGLLNAWQMALLTRKFSRHRDKDLKSIGYSYGYLDMHIIRRNLPPDWNEWVKYLGAACCDGCETYY